MACTEPYHTLTPESLAPSRLLRSLGLAPRKRLGQHFLVSKSALQHILAALAVEESDTIVEIGAGPGTLTGYLAAHAGRVLAVELDNDLVAYLRERFANIASMQIIHADILTLLPDDLLTEEQSRYKVVGNLPYYITSAALRHVLSWQPAPIVVVVMVQEEVARRIVATAGNMSLLALMVQVAGLPEMVARVPAGAFVPAPKVASAILKITPHQKPLAKPDEQAKLFRLARAAFHQRRKTLLNSLSAGLSLPKQSIQQALEQAGVSAVARAEDLSLAEWLALASTEIAEHEYTDATV